MAMIFVNTLHGELLKAKGRRAGPIKVGLRHLSIINLKQSYDCRRAGPIKVGLRHWEQI